jgi:hypothetical protein
MSGSALPYLIVVLLAVIVNNGCPPVPVSETVNVGWAVSLVAKLRLADSAPPAPVGVNVRLRAQLVFAATLPPHKSAVTAKSLGFAPAKPVV